MKPFRRYHLLKILNDWNDAPLPLDGMLRNYFRTHKAVGSKDRQVIADTIYGMIRWKGLIDAHSETPLSWENRLEAYLNVSLDSTHLPPHLKVSFPKFFYDWLKAAYGQQKADALCLASNYPAPTMVRVNSLKTTRETLLKRWKQVYEVSPCKQSSWGIIFHRKINFFALPEFKQGLFEIQDEGSQLVASHVAASPKDHILDFCAGSGGKTLAFAPQMNNQGQIYLYDIRPRALMEAKKRLKRAGIQNGQILDDKKLKRKGLLEKMDWILLDVPCSGTGTLRRNPDMKWKLSPEMITRLKLEQQAIFERALKYLHPQGKIVYATCSILPEENENQVAFFCEKYGLEHAQKAFQSFPKNGEMDGFFCAVLRRINE
ncbi:MAG: RsmB/NOP family class I SAM-dependent RNA methyltransferase [Chlamydiia bacterium]|nr:RsmB/NOP family class I SAM-dependent RNA methyltransferase [Chlamydiia bacterium]